MWCRQTSLPMLTQEKTHKAHKIQVGDRHFFSACIGRNTTSNILFRKKIMKKIRACWRFASILVYTLCCLWLIAFVLPGADGVKRGRIIRVWAGKLLSWLGIPVITEGKFPDEVVHDCGFTPGKSGRLVVCNHVSFLDIFTLDSVLPSSFVAKAEIAKWPVFGKIASAVGTIFIERGNRKALLSIGDNMKKGIDEGRSLLMFPEGTTSDGTGLLKLHANLFESAARTGAPVVPVVLRYMSGDTVTTAPAYVGDVGLFECLWKVVNTPDLKIIVKVLPAITGDDRRELCKAASAAMSAAIGTADPLAEKPAEAPAEVATEMKQEIKPEAVKAE